MIESQDRLDEILTAAMDYRTELAKEIRGRADLLGEQAQKMREAATVLDGQQPEEPDWPALRLREELENLKHDHETAMVENRRLMSRAVEAEAKLREAQTELAKGPPLPPDSVTSVSTVLLRTSSAKAEQNKQFMFSIPADLRDKLGNETLGNEYKVVLAGRRVIFEPVERVVRAPVPTPVIEPKEVQAEEPEPERPRLTLEQVRDAGIERGTFTVQSLADDFGVAYWTVYPKIQELVKKGIFVRAGDSSKQGFRYDPPTMAGPRVAPRGEPDMSTIGVGSESEAHGVVVPHTKPQGSSGKPGRDKKISKRTGRRPLRRGEKK